MKIKVITTFLLFCLIAGICYYISLPDYHVRNSMSFSNQGTRDTELTVIVYKYWGIDGVIKGAGAADAGLQLHRRRLLLPLKSISIILHG